MQWLDAGWVRKEAKYAHLVGLHSHSVCSRSAGEGRTFITQLVLQCGPGAAV